ncbi:peroxynitrite isomerase THAP4-like [Haliotis rufescens]|uniref:peroxynitrite isomerase THAP4-like n=1 Tax=Haliotis rufescens TaxID=6454 RepID=UPI00201F4196|nr:peroxynitrite isomerase THAP4-like [Haliotis rufescens]
MVNCCSVRGCSNRSNRDGKSYHSIPAVIINQGDRTRELSEQRRAQWIAKLGRENYSPTKYTKICSDHFVSGKPTTLYDISSPDWIPSLHMGTGLSLKDAQSLSRYRKGQRAQRKKVLAAAEMLVEMSRRGRDGDGRGSQEGVGGARTAQSNSFKYEHTTAKPDSSEDIFFNQSYDSNEPMKGSI